LGDAAECKRIRSYLVDCVMARARKKDENSVVEWLFAVMGRLEDYQESLANRDFLAFRMAAEIAGMPEWQGRHPELNPDLTEKLMKLCDPMHQGDFLEDSIYLKGFIKPFFAYVLSKVANATSDARGVQQGDAELLEIANFYKN
jgi:hypothetical protein